MAFDVKKHWPVIGAGALAVGAFLTFKNSAPAGAPLPLAPTDTSGGTAGVATGGGGIDQTEAGLLNQLMQYKASIENIRAGTYDTYIGANAADYAGSVQEIMNSNDNAARVQIALAQRPSAWQVFWNGITQAAATYYGMKGGGGFGGGYQPYGTVASRYPSTGGFPGYPVPQGNGF